MKENKLVSMTDFVLEQEKKCQDNILTLKEIFNYANFLRRPLKLEMFVCVDDEGNFLEEPQIQDRWISYDEILSDYDYEEVAIYKQSKEKVLFEGLNIDKVGPCYIVDFNDEVIYLGDDDSETIESLVKHNLILSDNAIKQLCHKPIPLTEDYLLKFGFRLVKHNIQDYYIIKGLFILKKNFYMNGFSFKLFGKEDICSVVYVHELQNLYFALTNQELTIQPNQQ